ncbi:hypothetical protein [Cohnella zeiphila]|uniref:Uncharacterized protein n=1 Tax=Cohnella zeiphila TaxID=2761120 RepID=A0A7X0VU57_9BACL|nr:hypothetical protein [Cohnella zeiphila]MBB6729907.1 hypothetical protein [Cohnella zeiphila]
MKATYDSLSQLVGQFASKPAVALSLKAKLLAAKAASAIGVSKAEAQAIQAFVKEANAQSGKALTAERAQFLVRLAEALAA